MHARYALIRHVLSIVVLPLAIVVLVPAWLAQWYGGTFLPADGLVHGLAQAIGALLAGVGLLLLVTSLYQIMTRSRQTLAPWDPPLHLDVRGPYRNVRNPVVSGVLFVLFGEAMLLGSLAHMIWALAFLAFSLVYVPLLEEPQLEARFGDEYRQYRRHVSRFLPRLRPWKPEAQ
jgi:protein-S-isoprenylcysteine O-methyltransferase Ste14